MSTREFLEQKNSVAKAVISNSQFLKLTNGIKISDFNSTSITQCVISNSVVQTIASVELLAKSITIDKLLCKQNKAVKGGCAMFRRFQSLSMKRALFMGNKCTEKGGALNVYSDGIGTME